MTACAPDLMRGDMLLPGRVMALNFASVLCGLACPLHHVWLPPARVWQTACALGLAVLGGLGVVLGARWLIVLAVFGHGLWNMTKPRGVGMIVFGWYLTACVLVDWSYAAAVSSYILTGGT